MSLFYFQKYNNRKLLHIIINFIADEENNLISATRKSDTKMLSKQKYWSYKLKSKISSPFMLNKK